MCQAKKKTECVPGSEQISMTKTGHRMMKCKCAECGITKTRFVPKNFQGVKGQGLLLGKNSPFGNIPLIGDIL